ncbi:peroxiredoxin family protein [Derxia lacustris]|uniref:peroxiredoxin family protein n=1 Tax=Derxia lacustris TaxID=764842 RepID=UPI001F46AABB|nr:TlpA disulfide reductase family protein [Derxia lacustris]
MAVAAGGFSLLGGGQGPAPDVALRTLAGESLKLSDLRGKVVLVNFWATSCTTCVHEMPALAEAHRRFAARGYETVAVAMSYDRPDYVANFAQERALPFKVAIDIDGAIAQAFSGIPATPTSFLVSKQGRILQRYVGEPDWEAFAKLVEAELAA